MSTTPRTSHRRPLLRFLWLAAGVAAAAAAAFTLPVEQLPAAVQRLGTAGIVAAVALGALLLGALVPRTAISLVCGALFGAVAGAATTYSAAMLAAAGTFAAGRLLGRDFVAGRVRGRLARLDTWLNRRGLLAVLLVRFLPIGPYGLVGYVYGTTGVRPAHYLLGTVIGVLPSSITYAVLGSAAVEPDTITPLTFLPAGIGMLLTTTVALYFRYTTRRAAAQDRAGAAQR